MKYLDTVDHYLHQSKSEKLPNLFKTFLYVEDQHNTENRVFLKQMLREQLQQGLETQTELITLPKRRLSFL